MRTSELLGIAMVLTAHAAAAAGPSSTDQVTARKLFNEGLDLREAGKIEEALSKFLAADALARTPKTRLELGRTHERLGHLVAAYEAYLSVKSLPVEAGFESKYAAVRAEAAQLAGAVRSRLAQIDLAIEQPIEKLEIDGEEIAPAAWKEPRVVDPGEHVITARVDGHEPRQLTITLKEGEHKTVAVEPGPPLPKVEPARVDPLPPPAAPPAPPARRVDVVSSSGMHWLFWVGAGVSGAALVTGAITGGIALHRSSSLEERCPDGCPPELEGELRTARRWATASTISFGVAAAGAGAMLVGALLPGSKRAAIAPSVGLGFVGVSGRF
jgi:hypothetical protein